MNNRSITELEWTNHRANALWNEVLNTPEVSYPVWAGIFAGIMGRIVQGTAEDPDDAIEIANEIIEAVATMMKLSIEERFGKESAQWQQ